MEQILKYCSFLVILTCLGQPAFAKTNSSVEVAALRHTTDFTEPSNVGNDKQSLEIRGWDSRWGPQPDPSNAVALLLYQFSEGKSYLTLEKFLLLLQCLSSGTNCPTADSLPFQALSNCTSNTALAPSHCRAFNKCLSQSEATELFRSVCSEDSHPGLSVSQLQELLPAVAAQSSQCSSPRAALAAKIESRTPLFSSRSVDDFTSNVTDASTSTESSAHKKATPGEVWGYGLLFVTLISVCSLVGVSVLPLMARAMYQQLMTGLIGLAVGSLAASAAFHLLPQAYNLPERYGNHDYLFTSLYFLLGLWAFLMIERLIKISIMMHSARRRESSAVKPSSSSQGIVNYGGSEDLSSPCPSVTVVSMKSKVDFNSDQTQASTAESKIDEMNRRNSDCFHNPPASPSHSSAQANLKSCSGYGAQNCPHHHTDHIIPRVVCRELDPDKDISFEELDDPAFNNACCTQKASRAQDKDSSVIGEKKRNETSPKSSLRLSNDGGSTADVCHLGCNPELSRSCSNDISCAAAICKPLEKEEVDLIFASQQQAIKASFGHEQKPSAGGHSHGAVEYRPGESSVIRTVAWMIIFGDGFHNFLDGVSIGAAFNANKMTGISISLAVMCEELPHELGDFAVLLNAGMSMKQALMYNFLSALTCYAGLVVGILLGEFSDNSYYIFALAAGMFIYISCVDMVPELNEVMNTACEKGDWKDIGVTMLLQNLGFALGVLSLFLLAYFADQITFD